MLVVYGAFHILIMQVFVDVPLLVKLNLTSFNFYQEYHPDCDNKNLWKLHWNIFKFQTGWFAAHERGKWKNHELHALLSPS